MTFNAGDRVEYTGNYWNISSGKVQIGQRGSVIEVTSFDNREPEAGNVSVRFDNGVEHGVFHGNLEKVVDEGPTKPEDPRTPETVYADSVDSLLRYHAERLKDAIPKMAFPYSHLGFLAEFLRDFEALEKP